MSEKKAYHHGDLRSDLLQAAERIISEEGVGGVTMRALSERTGVSHAAPYRHFADKTGILCAVAEEGFNRLREHLIQCVQNGSKDSADRFRTIALAYIDFAILNPAQYQLMYGKELAGGSPPESLRLAARAAFKEAVTALTACQDEGTVRGGDIIPLTSIVWAQIHGLSMLLIDGQIRTNDLEMGMHSLLVENNYAASTNARALAEMAVDTIMAGLQPKLK